jgi:hypothetical protein
MIQQIGTYAAAKIKTKNTRTIGIKKSQRLACKQQKRHKTPLGRPLRENAV